MTFLRILRYVVLRAGSLFVTVVIGVYLAILIANMGGYVDEIRKSANSRTDRGDDVGRPEAANYAAHLKSVGSSTSRSSWRKSCLGLDRPSLLRSFAYLSDALTLSLGRASGSTSDTGSRQVRDIIIERPPATLRTFRQPPTSSFFSCDLCGAFLSRRYGSWPMKPWSRSHPRLQRQRGFTGSS